MVGLKLQLINSVEGVTPGVPLMPVPATHGQVKDESDTPAGKTRLTLPVLPLVAPEVMLMVLAARTVTGNVVMCARSVVGSVPVTVTVYKPAVAVVASMTTATEACVPAPATTSVGLASVHPGLVGLEPVVVALSTQVNANGLPEAVAKPWIVDGVTVIVCGENRSLLVVCPWLTITGAVLVLPIVKSFTNWVSEALPLVKFWSNPSPL